MDRRKFAYIALSTIRHLPVRKLKELLVQARNEKIRPEDIFSLRTRDLIQKFGLSEDVAAQITNASRYIDGLHDKLEAIGVNVISFLDESYPATLKKSLRNGSPPLLFYIGNLEILARKSVGFCGSREATSKARQIAAFIADFLVVQGVNVVSGYARGIDIESHLAALKRGGCTTAVLPYGIARFSVRNEIKEFSHSERVLFLSQFPPRMPWRVSAAMERNKVICALSDAVIVVQARMSGGTLDAGRQALALNRPLFVVDYGSRSRQSAGNSILLREGGKPLRKAKKTGKPNLTPLLHVLSQEQAISQAEFAYTEHSQIH